MHSNIYQSTINYATTNVRKRSVTKIGYCAKTFLIVIEIRNPGRPRRSSLKRSIPSRPSQISPNLKRPSPRRPSLIKPSLINSSLIRPSQA